MLSAVTLGVFRGSRRAVWTYVSIRFGAICAQVSYFERFGWPPDGKTFFLFFVCGDRPLWESLKEGTDTVTADL